MRRKTNNYVTEKKMSMFAAMKEKTPTRCLKMRSTILLATCLLLLAGCGTDAKKNDLQRENLKGKIASYSEYYYLAKVKFGEVVKGELLEVRKFTYNPRGNRTEINQYDPSGVLWYKLKYKYDPQGNRTEANWYDSEGRFFAKAKFKFDDKGNCVETMYHNVTAFLLNHKLKSKFDPQGNRTEDNIYGLSGELISKTKYKYNDKGNCTEETQYNSSGIPERSNRYVYTYNSEGNWVKRITIEGDVATKVCEREYEYLVSRF